MCFRHTQVTSLQSLELGLGSHVQNLEIEEIQKKVPPSLALWGALVGLTPGGPPIWCPLPSHVLPNTLLSLSDPKTLLPFSGTRLC